MWSAGICRATGLEVLEGLLELGARVHHERPVGRDRLADRLAAEDEHLEGLGARVLGLVGREHEVVAVAVHGQLALVDRALRSVPTVPWPAST